MTNNHQFGIWMDSHHAIVVGSGNPAEEKLTVLAHIDGEEVPPAGGGKIEHNQKTMLQAKYFKKIATHLDNATLLHATGTGQAQEQFLHYLAATPQFKNLKTEESTANKMSDERLVEFFTEKFHKN